MPRSILLWFIIVSLFVANLLLTIITFSHCSPASHLWQRLDPSVPGHRQNPIFQERMELFQGGEYSPGAPNVQMLVATSSFTDMVLVVVPLPPLWRLQMPLVRKLGIMVVLSLGIIAGHRQNSTVTRSRGAKLHMDSGHSDLLVPYRELVDRHRRLRADTTSALG